MIRKYWLDPDRLVDRETMGEYMSELFGFDEVVRSLDALNDNLSEVVVETRIYLSRETARIICDMPYGYKVLMVLADAAEGNPYLSIHFRERSPKNTAA